MISQNNKTKTTKFKMENSVQQTSQNPLDIKVFYTGIGANTNGIHTPSEFLKIMNDNFTHRTWRDELSAIPREIHPSLRYKDWILPDDFFIFSLDDWIDYSGASLEEN
jgi:hypothetical protein